jgi:hypothetical protein
MARLTSLPAEEEVTTKYTKSTKNHNFKGNSSCGDVLESRGEFSSRRIFFVLFVSFVVTSLSNA